MVRDSTREPDIMVRAPMETAGFAAGDHGGPGHDGGGNGDSSHLDCTVRVYFGVRCRGSLRAFSGAAEPTKVHEASRFGFDQWDFLG